MKDELSVPSTNDPNQTVMSCHRLIGYCQFYARRVSLAKNGDGLSYATEEKINAEAAAIGLGPAFARQDQKIGIHAGLLLVISSPISGFASVAYLRKPDGPCVLGPTKADILKVLEELRTEAEIRISQAGIFSIAPASRSFPADHINTQYGIQPNTLNKARRTGRLPATKVGGRWFYLLTDIEKLWPDVFRKDDQT